MTSERSVDALNRELRAARPDLVGNTELLRGVLAGCGDCIKVLDLDGRLQFMSEGGKRFMEVDDFSALKGCPWPDFWPGEGNVEAVAAVKAAKAGKTARFRGPANTAKGTPRYWDVQVSPIFGANGPVWRAANGDLYCRQAALPYYSAKACRHLSVCRGANQRRFGLPDASADIERRMQG